MDRFVELSKEEYAEITSHPCLGEGQCGKVYELDEKNVIKLWHPKITSGVMSISNKLVDFTDFYYKISALVNKGIESNAFIFPTHLVFYLDQFYGYIAKKVIGNNFTDEAFLNLNLEKLYNEIKKIQEEIIRLSLEYHLAIKDIKFANMILEQENENLWILDTDLYLLLPKEDKDNICKTNLKNFNVMFFRAFVSNNITNHVINNNKVRNLLNDFLNTQFSDLLYCILENKEDSINSLQDIKTYSLK